jgi:hypothetical protein
LLCKFYIQFQSQNKNTPTPTNIIKQAEEIKKTDEDEENEIKKDAIEIHKIKEEQSSYTGSGHGRQTMAAGSTGTILWGRNIQQETVMEATPNYQQIINSVMNLIRPDLISHSLLAFTIASLSLTSRISKYVK